jgi:DNA replication protein DnaC
VTNHDESPLVSLLRDFPPAEGSPAWDDWPFHAEQNIERGRDRITQLVPARYAEATATAPEVAAWVRALVEGAARSRKSVSPLVNTGPSLLVLGPTGTGKTHQAYGAMRALSLSGVSAPWRFSTAADIYAQMRPRHKVDSEEVFESYAKARVLVVDDLGAAKGSEWNEEVNYRLINYRYEQELPTLITSNVPAKELGAVVGERVASRLTEMAQRVVLRGEDRRRTVRQAA